MTGLAAYPDRTLLDRALELLGGGPHSPSELSERVLGLPRAPLVVAERLAVALLGADPRVRRMEDGRWSLVAAAQAEPLIEESVFAVVDVETTGMRPRGEDRITEIAAVALQGNRRWLLFESLVNPGVPIPPRISAVTGITQAMVRGAPPFGEIAQQVVEALAGRVFVAHNLRFDWSFVAVEVRRALGLRLEGPSLCTVRLARRLLADLESRSLDSLSHYFGLENPARHRATGDALVTAELLERLLQMARKDGARTVTDLIHLCRRKTSARPA